MPDRIRITASPPGFAPIPLRLLCDSRVLDQGPLIVYQVLASFIDYGTGSCWPSLRKIAELARCCPDTAAKHINHLCELGYVEKRSGKATGKPNSYHLMDPWGRQGGTEDVEKGTESFSGGVPKAVPEGVPNSYSGRTRLKDETQEREREEPPSPALEGKALPDALRAGSRELRGADTGFEDRAVDLLRAGHTGAVILEGWRRCLQEAPTKARWFAQDFTTKWLPRVQQALAAKAEAAAKIERGRSWQDEYDRHEAEVRASMADPAARAEVEAMFAAWHARHPVAPPLAAVAAEAPHG